MKLVDKCLGPLFRLASLPGDDLDTTVRKKLLVSMYFFAFVVLFFALLNSYVFYTPGFRWQFISIHIGFVGAAGGLGWVLTKKTVPDALVEVTTGLFLVHILMLDWYGVAHNAGRSWQFVVLIIDVVLVAKVRRRAANWIIAATVGWLLVSGVETSARFGLFDVYGGPDTTERESRCGCDNPPCAVDAYVAVFDVSGYCLIFALDYYFTRGFADQVNDEKKTMIDSIEITRRISAHLAAFDLLPAEEDLAAHGATLPPALVETLSEILSNLKMYKPYLPQSCLPEVMTDQETILSETSAVTGTGTAVSAVLSTGAASSIVSISQPILEKSFEKRRGGVTVFNMKNSKSAITSSPLRFPQVHSKYLSLVFGASRVAKGVVDLFEGDKIVVTFNASKKCPSYAVGAGGTAQRVTTADPCVNAGVACGVFYGGDMGCTEMRRFNILGEITPMAHRLERVGRKLDAPVLCNSATHSDASFTLSFRVCLKKVIHHGKQIILYELPPAASTPLTPPTTTIDHRDAEWMYSLEKGTASKWSVFNTLCKTFLMSDGGRGSESIMDSLADVDNDNEELRSLLMQHLPFETIEL